MRDWELVLYKYADFGVKQSSARLGINWLAPPGAFPSRRFRYRGHSLLLFFFFALEIFSFSIFQPLPLVLFVLSRRYTEIVLFLSI